MRWTLATFLLLTCVAIVGAAEPVRTVLPPDIRDVYIDPTGRAIMQVSDGDWRATAETVFAGKAAKLGGAKILLIDHLHRIWLRPDEDKELATVQMFDGKTWLTRSVSDIPADANRVLGGAAADKPAAPTTGPAATPTDPPAVNPKSIRERAAAASPDANNGPAGIHFVGVGYEDSSGNVWFVDGDHLQGWWIHQFSPDGKWSTLMLHQRATQGASARKKKSAPWLDFTEPQMQIGPDGLLYAAWSSKRLDGGPGLGASGFQQYDGTHWSEYFYPTGSTGSDNVFNIIPLPDGSVGFAGLGRNDTTAKPAPGRRRVFINGELQQPQPPAIPSNSPRVVWMTSALSRPAPDLSGYLDRLGSVSAHDRDTAQAELIAMGPRIRKSLEGMVDQTEDPEVKSRIPMILQDIAKPPTPGLYGGTLTFTAWRPLFQGASGRVFLAVKTCKNLSSSAEYAEALVTVSPLGVWSAVDSPTKAYHQPIDALDLFEDATGRRWLRITKVGVLLDDGKSTVKKISDDADASFRGVDSAGRMYMLGKTGVVMLNPAAVP